LALELNSFTGHFKDILVCTLLDTMSQAHFRYHDYALYKFTIYLLQLQTFVAYVNSVLFVHAIIK